MEKFVLVTFDLDKPEDGDYKKAYKLLEDIGLYQISPQKSLHLPTTTVLGKLNISDDAKDIRDFIWEYLEINDIRVSKILGGVLSDWALKIKH